MSHHSSGPDFRFPRGDARLDMTDFYAFPKPGDPGKSIIILNVHPSYSVNPPGPTTTEPFAPGALYELKIDTDGDAAANLTYSVQFSSSGDGKQTATLRRNQGVRAAGVGEDGEDQRILNKRAHRFLGALTIRRFKVFLSGIGIGIHCIRR